MGIYYQFAIRFITVKDITKVDKRCIPSTDDNDNDDDFTDYLTNAKENVATKLKEVSFDSGTKNAYTVENITVPEGTEVITFGNNACDRRGGVYYEIYFNYQDESDDYVEYRGTTNERNRFMIIPQTNKSSSLISMDYIVGGTGGYADNTYTEEDCIIKTF